MLAMDRAPMASPRPLLDEPPSASPRSSSSWESTVPSEDRIIAAAPANRLRDSPARMISGG